MKKTLTLLLVMTTLLGAATAMAANKQRATENRRVDSFERIKIQGSPNVKYTQGKTCSVRVEAPADLMSRVETTVSDGQLVVSLRTGSRGLSFGTFSSGEVNVYVTSPDLIGVEVLGSGDFKADWQVDTDCMTLRVKGSGDIDFKDIICDHLRASLTGSGNVEIDRLEARTSTLELVGSGDVKVSEHRVGQTKVTLKGSGDVSLRLTQCGTVDCMQVGSGDITLRGDVARLTKSSRGSGNISTRGLVIRKN